MLEGRDKAYVLAVLSNHDLKFIGPEGPVKTSPAEFADSLGTDAVSPHAAGAGSKCIRLYDWARPALPWDCPDGRERWVLVR